ncbi:hypothetical protein [Paenibacillus tengchongensis]|uniref:hypothetical protein n=1 Tax=Paenibacillus tengchongensis TaxID=2608684 RepID=UPI00124CAED3|nr:hypothetical protein [Paenibacillus tengchongensis]
MAHILSNGILTVQIEEPGTYSGTRFDWTGFISQVRLEHGQHTFCVPESLTPGAGTGGAGLCNEFGIVQAIGYDEAEAGEWFPKPGVGLLQKNYHLPYSFSGSYPLIPFKVDAELSRTSAVYTVEPLECRGYSMLLTKTLVLNGDRIEIGYTLENKGSKTIRTEEYVHNFLGIDGAPAGSDYRLTLPGLQIEDAESAYTEELLEQAEDSLTWKRQPHRPFYCRLGSISGSSADYFWELLHVPGGCGVRESGDFAPSRMALWGERHVISPEVFVKVAAKPGQTVQWRRSFQFFGR